jgi:hypothetical protein
MASVSFRCPRCGADFITNPGSPSSRWTCASGHIFDSSRELIGALLARGWRPDIEVWLHGRDWMAG